MLLNYLLMVALGALFAGLMLLLLFLDLCSDYVSEKWPRVANIIYEDEDEE